MIQHPVVEGFEPDADILSIHIARFPLSARHAEYCFKDQSEAETPVLDVETRKTKSAHANTAWAYPSEARRTCQAMSGRLANRV